MRETVPSGSLLHFRVSLTRPQVRLVRMAIAKGLTLLSGVIGGTDWGGVDGMADGFSVGDSGHFIAHDS